MKMLKMKVLLKLIKIRDHELKDRARLLPPDNYQINNIFCTFISNEIKLHNDLFRTGKARFTAKFIAKKKDKDRSREV